MEANLSASQIVEVAHLDKYGIFAYIVP